MTLIPQAGPPPPQGPFVPIFSPRGPGGRVEGLILSHAVCAINAHLVGTPPYCRTLACLRADNESPVLCPHCESGWPRRWRGYLGFQSARSGRVGLVEITPFAARNAAILNCKTATLRGKRLVLVRGPGRRNAHVTATLQEALPADSPDLPPDLDVFHVLARIMTEGGIAG